MNALCFNHMADTKLMPYRLPSSLWTLVHEFEAHKKGRQDYAKMYLAFAEMLDDRSYDLPHLNARSRCKLPEIVRDCAVKHE